MAALSEEFAGICLRGRSSCLPGPLPSEVREGDHLDLQRIAFASTGSPAHLRRLIDALNSLPSAPPPPAGLPVPPSQRSGTEPARYRSGQPCRCSLSRSISSQGSVARPQLLFRHGGQHRFSQRRRGLRAECGVRRSMNRRRTALRWLGAAALISWRPAAVTPTMAPRRSEPHLLLLDQASLGHPCSPGGTSGSFPSPARGPAGTAASRPRLRPLGHQDDVVLVAESGVCAQSLCAKRA